MELAGEIILILILSASVLLIVLPGEIEKYRAHRNASGTIQNTDAMMREFCYRVEKTTDEILSILSVPGSFDGYSYSFDRKNMIITFSHAFRKPDHGYQVFLYPKGQECLMKVSAVGGWMKGNDLPYIQNPFWVKILDAVPVSYITWRTR